MARRTAALALAVMLVAVGLWFSRDLGTLQAWLFGAGMVGLVGISAESFLEQPLETDRRNHGQLFGLWIAPSLLVVAGLWLIQAMPLESQVGVAGVMAGLMAVLLLGMKASVDPAGRFRRQGRFVANLILYLLLFLLFALIYQTRERSLITATSIGAIALLAALELLRSGQDIHASAWRLAALVALVVAETTWALNYWPVSGLVGGAMLLLTFYVFMGLLMSLQEGGLDRSMLVEYGSVGIVGLATITWAMP